MFSERPRLLCTHTNGPSTPNFDRTLTDRSCAPRSLCTGDPGAGCHRAGCPIRCVRCRRCGQRRVSLTPNICALRARTSESDEELPFGYPVALGPFAPTCRSTWPRSGFLHAVPSTRSYAGASLRLRLSRPSFGYRVGVARLLRVGSLADGASRESSCCGSTGAFAFLKAVLEIGASGYGLGAVGQGGGKALGAKPGRGPPLKCSVHGLLLEQGGDQDLYASPGLCRTPHVPRPRLQAYSLQAVHSIVFGGTDEDSEGSCHHCC